MVWNALTVKLKLPNVDVEGAVLSSVSGKPSSPIMPLAVSHDAVPFQLELERNRNSPLVRLSRF